MRRDNDGEKQFDLDLDEEGGKETEGDDAKTANDDDDEETESDDYSDGNMV